MVDSYTKINSNLCRSECEWSFGSKVHLTSKLNHQKTSICFNYAVVFNLEHVRRKLHARSTTAMVSKSLLNRKLLLFHKARALGSKSQFKELICYWKKKSLIEGERQKGKESLRRSYLIHHYSLSDKIKLF